jgi:serine/threonine-protein kinase
LLGCLLVLSGGLGAKAAADEWLAVVTDGQGVPVPGAWVYVHGTQAFAKTDASGAFHLPPPLGDDVVTIVAEGFETLHIATPHALTLRTTALQPREFILEQVEQFTFRDTIPLQTKVMVSPPVPGDDALIFPFQVREDARGGLVNVSWTEPAGEPPVYLRAEVRHAASHQGVTLFNEANPIVARLPAGLLRDHVGEYELRIRVSQGAARDLPVEAHIEVAYGPRDAKTVLGRAPTVRDEPGIDQSRPEHPDMDILSVRFANETDDEFDAVLELDRLVAPRPLAPFQQAEWSVSWVHHRVTYFAALEAVAGDATPVFRLGTCDATACLNHHQIPGAIELGQPGRITFHVPKAWAGAPNDGDVLTDPRAIAFQGERDDDRYVIASARLTSTDEAGPGSEYVFGAHEFDLPAGLGLNRPVDGAAGPGTVLAQMDQPAILIVAAALVGSVGVIEWQRRQRRVHPWGRKYAAIRLLGSGASGRVILARHRVLNRLVAIKELRLDGDAAARERFIAEARIAAAVRHPNIVGVLDVEERGDKVAIVMEYVDGGNLETVLARRGAMGDVEALALWRDLVTGLAALHAAGIIHRDVKPTNILLTKEGRAKLADFGVARAPGDFTLGGSGPVGTPLYMAPEVLRGGPPTAASDVYAATTVLYRMLTGRAPLELSGHPWEALVDRRGQRPALPVPGLSRWLNDLLARGLAENAARRPKDAVALLEELDRRAT